MSNSPELEAELRRRLTGLADRVVTSPDALDRILAGGSSPAGPPPRSRVLRRASVWSGPDPAPNRRDGAVGRRRLLLATALAAAVAAGVLVVTGLTSVSRRPVPTSVLRAAAGPGSLEPVAFVSGGRLYVTAGEGPPRVVASTGDPQGPQWSADHQWLAYATGSNQVHVVGADGTGDRAVATRAVEPGAFDWAPDSDLLAVVPAGGGVQVVSPTGGAPVQAVTASVPIESIAWSRDGTRIAYSTPAGPGSASGVYVVPASGGAVQAVPVQLPAGASALLATWWPDGTGLLIWVDPEASPTALENGLRLESVALSGGAPRPLVVTLVYHPWLAWSPDGSRLLVVAGAGASPAAGKHLAVCDPISATCTALPQPEGTVSIDPAWSPDGTEVAFVRAPDTGQPDNLDDTPGWFPSRQLWVEAADGSDAHPVAGAAGGVVLPAWSPDGRFIGYSTGSTIDTVMGGGGGATVVAREMTGSNDGTSGPDANGKGPWSPSAVWGSRGGFYLSPP